MRNRTLTGTDKGVGYHARFASPVRFECDARPDEFAEVQYRITGIQLHETADILRMLFHLERARVDVLAIRSKVKDELGLGCTITPHKSTPIQAVRSNGAWVKTGIWFFPLGMKLIVEPTAWNKVPETVEDYT